MREAQFEIRAGVRIMQVLLDPRVGGAERVADTLETEWSSRGHHCRTVYVDPTEGASRLPMVRVARLVREMYRFRPDLVVAHSAIPNIFARVCAPFWAKVIVVLHSATDDFSGAKLRYAERVLRKRALVVAVSQSQAVRYRTRFGAKNLRVIPNGVPDSLPFRSRMTPQMVNVVTVARVALQKRPELWQSVATEAARIGASLEFTWFGPAQRNSGMNALISQHESDNRAGVFAGPTDQPAEVMAAADLLFHPASREAHSIALIEAAAVGLPIVCSAEVAETLPSGIVAATFSGETDVLDAILGVQGDWPQAQLTAAANAPKVRERYSAAACAQEYIRFASGER